MGLIFNAIMNVIWDMLYPYVDGFLTMGFDLVFGLNGSTNATVISAFQVITNALRAVGISLIVMLFLKKGFSIYVLWIDGDPEASPILLLTNFAKAIAVALCFPSLYNIIIKGVSVLLNDVLLKDLSSTINFGDIKAGVGATDTVFCVIFLVCTLMLGFQFFKRALEICILNAGVPLACVGLLDNDKGVFKAYFTMFVKAVVTTLFQIVMLKISMTILLTGGFDIITKIWGIACIVFAITLPKLLQEFFIQTGGGGGLSRTMSTAHYAQSLAASFKRLMK